MATTVRKLLTGALRLVNVVQANETPAADDMDITLQALQGLMDSWSNDSYMIYTMNPYTFTTVGGQQEYTLGVGGDWDVERPMQINQAYVHYQAGGSQPVDMPIALLNDAQWASIAVKSIQTTFPTMLYDNGNYPLRTISLYPIPTGTQEIVLWLWQPLLNFANLDQEITLPPGYERAIRFSLAVEIAPEFGKILPEDVIAKAMRAKSELKSINAVPQYQTFDRGISGPKGAIFNWIIPADFLPFR